MSRLGARIAVAGCVLLPAIFLFLFLGALAVNVPYWDDYGAIVRYMGWPFPERGRRGRKGRSTSTSRSWR